MDHESETILSRVNDFTYGSYESFIEFLSKRYNIVPFRDYLSQPDPRLILRHDIDGSMTPALRIAKLESTLGIRSTFLVAFSMRYYNLFEKSSFAGLKIISEMGHEIGLHYDSRQYAAYSHSPHEILRHELKSLEMLTGKPVKTIARHNVSLGGDDPFAGSQGLFNAYDEEFFKNALYVSDSCRAWRHYALRRLLSESPPRVQLVIHPMLWSGVRRTRYELLDSFFNDIKKENTKYKRDWKSLWKRCLSARDSSLDRRD